MPFPKSPLANLALVTLASLTGAVRASYDEEVSAALDILNTFRPENAESFCLGFIGYDPLQPTSPVAVTTTTPGASSQTGFNTQVSSSTAQTPSGYPYYSKGPSSYSTGYMSYGTGYPSYGTGYSSSVPGYSSYGTGYPSSVPGYTSSMPGYGANSQEVITILTTTTITYTVTSTIYAPAASQYGAYPALAQRDTFCDDFNVPCRLVQYSAPVISEACAKYLSQTESTTPDTATEEPPQAIPFPSTLSSTSSSTPSSTPPSNGNNGAGDGEDLPDAPNNYDPTGDGEDAPGASNYDPTGDGEDAPDAPNSSPSGDGEGAPDPSSFSPTGDGEDLPDAPYGSAGDGEA